MQIFRNLTARNATATLYMTTKDVDAVVDCYRDELDQFRYFVTVPSKGIVNHEISQIDVNLMGEAHHARLIQEKEDRERAQKAEEARVASEWTSIMCNLK